MKMGSVQRLRCPFCRHAELNLDGKQNIRADEVVDGSLHCDSCKREYPIVNGIPRFVSPDNYAGSFGFQWNLHCRTQLDSYSGFNISRDRVHGVSNWPEQMKGQRILEAGSGAGRFTEVLLSSGADVYSFDYSNAVDANWKNNSHFPNLHLFQGDIFNMPIADESFDKVFCFGVIQHTPDPEKAFICLASKVSAGGELVIDVYAKSLLSLLQWKYLLRSITKRLDKEFLYKLITKTVDVLLPLAIWLRRIGGRIGARIVPIVEYSALGLPVELNREWAILDTFDMYSPAHDHPRSVAAVRDWFRQVGFEKIEVRRGPNGVVGKGVRPAAISE